MKKKIIPYAVVATLTFGFTASTAQAIESNEASEYFTTVVDWSETDWNSYLEVNYGTTLAEYETVAELEVDIGPPVDLSTLGNADTSDANVLDIMERYNMSAEELVIFLDTYENVERIYFLGDLEIALEQAGFDQVNNGQDSEEPATEEESDQSSEEPATEEENEQSSEEPTSEEETDQSSEKPATEEGTDQNNEETAAEEEIDSTFKLQLEEVYLTPLGWTQDDFSIYLEDNYGMILTDFESFEALESTVGLVLNDERLQDILDSYELTLEEYHQLLGEYGEVPEDYNFVYEVEEALDYYTSEEVENADTEKGSKMPKTATDSLLMTLGGFGAAAAGAFMLFRRKPQGEK